MIGDVTLRAPAITPMRAARTIAPANWKRRTIEVLVSLLAFAVWGILAYKGFFRLLARVEGMPIGGSWILDALSLLVGVSGSIAGVSALWALAMRALGRTPKSLVGAPDDGPEDLPPALRR
ncbi:hypothetical protein rosag_20950 [Roseisolibacter agri]|uniref:Uncharacterized protein n=2 Tax=Roseisolibacter agri TaxID=2014610 RepID=A0AA37Q6H2_9BACT|nr:hypothetical protein rosag_20950 [Roseisolibacter agri]